MEAPRYDGLVYIALGLFILAPFGAYKIIEVIVYIINHFQIIWKP